MRSVALSSENPDDIGDNFGGRPLEHLARDLTAQAGAGELQRAFSREPEVRRTVEILLAREASNPILVGPPGCGKTAIANELAFVFNSNQYSGLRDVRLFDLSISAFEAGASFRGQLEQRITDLGRELEESKGKKIVFIDEVHQVVGGGGSAGTGDLANRLKPLLLKPGVRIIGATTTEEYSRYIESDLALRRRFQKVDIAPPSDAALEEILRMVRPDLERRNGVRIKDSALSAAIRFYGKLSDEGPPASALKLIDSAAIAVAVDAEGEALVTLPSETELAEMLEQCASANPDVRHSVQEKASDLVQPALRAALTAERASDYDAAARIRYEIIPLLKGISRFGLEELPGEGAPRSDVRAVSEDDVIEIVSRESGIPVTKLNPGVGQSSADAVDYLSGRIVGQEEAVEVVAKAFVRSKSGFGNRDRPEGTFLFLGPTGVGKTELAKALSDLVGADTGPIRFDMSEFQEPHSVAKLLGAPPGYAGHEEGGLLVDQVRRNPNSVVLFDEAEKAHPQILTTLLQLLDEGRLTDSRGREANFDEAFVVLTSNVPEEELEQRFSPEFLSRLQKIPFKPLTHDVMARIVSLHISEPVSQARERGIDLRVADSAIELLANRAAGANEGARRVRQLIDSDVKDLLVDAIQAGETAEGDVVELATSGNGDGSLALRQLRQDSSQAVSVDKGPSVYSSKYVEEGRSKAEAEARPYLYETLNLISKERWKDAAAALKRARKSAPKWGEVDRITARLHAEQDDVDKALSAYNDAVELDPTSVLIRFSFSYFLMNQVRDFKAAQHQLEEAVRLNPTSPHLRSNLGRAYLYGWNGEAAIRETLMGDHLAARSDQTPDWLVGELLDLRGRALLNEGKRMIDSRRYGRAITTLAALRRLCGAGGLKKPSERDRLDQSHVARECIRNAKSKRDKDHAIEENDWFAQAWP